MVRFHFRTAARVKMSSGTLLFRIAYFLHHQTPIVLMLEAAINPETSVDFYQTTGRNVPEDKSFSK
jgi:hypothetical protein